MNYRHHYHAGNFADVVKHTILIELITTLLQKLKPFCYLDTHAGIGGYSLLAEAAQQTQEFTAGIDRVLTTSKLDKQAEPSAITTYRQLITACNATPSGSANNFPTVYPGSPQLVRALLRPEDRMLLSELHPEDYYLLKRHFQHDPQVAVHHSDGYQLLKAFLPPQPRRGLVLIDPAYEQTDEFSRLVQAVTLAWQRWPTGIYAIWYPSKPHLRTQLNRSRQSLSQLVKPNKLLTAELHIHPVDSPLLLNGCGLWIINPPWQLEQKLTQLLPWLWQVLNVAGAGNYSVQCG